MKKIYIDKFKKASIQFEMECKCGGTIYVSDKEIRFIGKTICQFCENTVYFPRVDRISIKMETRKEKISSHNQLKSESFNKGKNNILGNTPAPDYSDVLNSLINLGFSKKSAAAKIEKAVFILGSNAIPEKVLEKAVTI